jgi:hypothetical protein
MKECSVRYSGVVVAVHFHVLVHMYRLPFRPHGMSAIMHRAGSQWLRSADLSYFPLCGVVAFDVEVDVDEPEAEDVAGVCGWKNGCCVLSPEDGALVTWKGANRIGGKDIVKL